MSPSGKALTCEVGRTGLIGFLASEAAISITSYNMSYVLAPKNAHPGPGQAPPSPCRIAAGRNTERMEVSNSFAVRTQAISSASNKGGG